MRLNDARCLLMVQAWTGVNVATYALSVYQGFSLNTEHFSRTVSSLPIAVRVSLFDVEQYVVTVCNQHPTNTAGSI